MKRNLRYRVTRYLCVVMALVAMPVALMAGPMKSIHKDYSVSPAQGQLKSSEYQCWQSEADGVVGLTFRRISGGYARFSFGCYSDKAFDATVTVKWRCSGDWPDRPDSPKISLCGAPLDVPVLPQTVGDFMEVTVPIGEFLRPGVNWIMVETARGMDTTTFQILSVSIDSDKDVLFAERIPEGNDWGPDSSNVRLCGDFHWAEREARRQKKYWEGGIQDVLYFGSMHRRKAIKLYQHFLDISSTVVKTSKSQWMSGWAKDYADRARFELLDIKTK